MPMRSALKEGLQAWLVATGLFDDGSVVSSDFEYKKLSCQKGKALVSCPTNPIITSDQYRLKTETYTVVAAAQFHRRVKESNDLTVFADDYSSLVHRSFARRRTVLWSFISPDVLSTNFNSVDVAGMNRDIIDQQLLNITFSLSVSLTRETEE